MKLIIDIPKEIYELIINDKSELKGLAKAVKNGIPLPKGHGKLIDVDNIQEIELEDSLTVLTHTKGDEVAWHIDAPTILEADNAESEESSDEDSN